MLTEEQGVQAIIALQKASGKTETEEEAKISWGVFSTQEKEITEHAHLVVCGGFTAKH